MALSKETVAQLYVALFQRAAAKDELDSWYKWAEDNNADMNKLAGAMLYSAVQVAKSDEDAAKFYPDYANLGDTTVTADQAKAIIENVYSLLLGKDYTTDPDGIDGWVKNVVDNGGTYTALGDTLAGIVYVANQYANGELEATDDATKKAVEAFKNKTQAAVETAETIPTNDPTGDGKVDFDVFQNIVKVVTDDPATIDEAKKVIEDYTPKSFDLSTAKEEILGNDAANTFKAVVSALSSEATLNSGDKIDGKGGVDTLDIDMKGSFAGVGNDGYIKNIEKVGLTNNTTINRTFDATNVTGVDTYNLTGSSSGNSISLTNLEKAGITVNLKDMSQNLSIGFDSNTDLSGTSDAMILGVNNLGKADPTPDNGSDDATYTKITMDKIEDVTINTTDAKSYIDLSGLSASTSVTVKGDQDLAVKNIASTLKTFDASENSGAVTATFKNVTAGALKTIKTAEKDDVVSINSSVVTSAPEINLGDGKDELKLNVDASSAVTMQPKMSGVETLHLTGLNSNLTFSASQTSGLENVIFDVDKSNGNKATLANVGDSDINLKIANSSSTSALNNQGATIQLDNSGNVTVDVTDKAASTTSTSNDNTTVTLTKAQSATINIGKSITESGTFTASSASQVTLNVDSALDSSNTETTKFTGNLVAAKATDVTIDAKGQVTLNNTSSLAKAQNITLKAENKTASKIDLTNGTNTTAAQFLNLKAASSVNLSGDGQIVLGHIGTDGTTPVDYNLTVTASGLSKGLDFNNVATKQNLTLDLSDVTGKINANTTTNATLTGANVTVNASGLLDNIRLGTVDANTAKNGTADLDFSNNLGTVTVGNIGGTRAFDTIKVNTSNVSKAVSIGSSTADTEVNINASGALNNVTIGAISQGGTGAGKQGVNSVTVDLSGSLGTNTIGTDDPITTTRDIKVISSLTYKAGATNATNSSNGLDILIDNDGTHNFTGDLTGNGKAETIWFTLANNKKEKVVLKGDMGTETTGTDNITVDASSVTTSSNNVTIDISALKNYDSSTLTGGAGANTITGGAGNDSITGGGSADTLKGGKGNDTITGGAGNDTMDGGAGSDTYVINTASSTNSDKIKDSGTSSSDTDILRFDNSADFTNVTADGTNKKINTDMGIETIKFGANSVTATVSSAQISGESLTINFDSKTSTTLAVNGTSNADTIDLSNLTVSNASASSTIQITGGADNDTITLSGGVDTVKFDTEANNGDDTIKSFTVGANKDVIDFITNEATQTDYNETDVSGGAVDLSSASHGLEILCGASANSLSEGDVKTFINAKISKVKANDVIYFVVTDGNNAGIYLGTETDGADGGVDTVKLIATLEGIHDLTAFDATNFADFS
ncbi:hypothetical protein [Caminibacter sp.]